MVPDRQVNAKVRQWLADLLRRRQSKVQFTPPARIQELCDLTHYHKTLIQEHAQQINHLQKALQAASIKPSHATDHVSSMSGMELVVAAARGKANSKALAELAYGHNRTTLQELCQSVEGRVPAHQRFLISSILSHMGYLEMTTQNVQMAIKMCILSSEETIDQLNSIPVTNQIDSNIISSGITLYKDYLLYKRPIALWAGILPGKRQRRCKRFSGNTTRHAIFRELVQTIAQDKDTFRSAMDDHQTGKKRAVIALAHKLLVTSYHILQNNKLKPHQELTLGYYEQPDATGLQQCRGYRFGQLVINCCISICLMAGLALIFHSPFVFPSLGPTVFLFFYKPNDPSASPRNILMGHAIATLVGYFSLVVTGLTAASPAFAVGVTWPRIIAIGLSLGLTVGLMVLLRAPHPPAAATTLIISLGTMTKPWQLLVLMLAVIVLTVQALIINRLAGIDYPLWHSQPAQHHYTDINQNGFAGITLLR